MKTKQKWRMGSMTLKLNISKAYDRVEWLFLETMMKKLGFGTKLINIVMLCISFVQYAVLINGQARHYFRPSQRLR